MYLEGQLSTLNYVQHETLILLNSLLKIQSIQLILNLTNSLGKCSQNTWHYLSLPSEIKSEMNFKQK